MEQSIRFCTTPDQIRLAYATTGQGYPLVKAANWLTHLEFDWQSPVWKHWWESLSQRYQLIRYDERLCGLSDWEAAEFSMHAWVSDLETVVNQTGVERFALLGVSQGASVAIAYTVRHPERVSHLILYGGYVQGRFHRNPSPEHQAECRMLVDLIRHGWGKDNPAFRQVFSTLFLPEGTIEQTQWLNDLARITASPENAARMEEAFYQTDVTDLAPQIAVPTLVLHAKGDAMCPFEGGRLMATLIPNAKFVPLQSKNHILLEHEPAWEKFLQEIHQFLNSQSETVLQNINS
ncbi:MAG TPA: alpha/beta hydrolase, partial [Allocoleopsis sp.]